MNRPTPTDRHADGVAPVPTIVVVGTGPRGVAVLERLLANQPEFADGVRVVLADPYLERGSRVWRDDQHVDLLMNTVTGDITLYTDATVTCAGPQRPGPTQYQWARAVAAGEIAQSDHVVAEARRLQPWSYATRGFQGHYLRWALRRAVDSAPQGVTVDTISNPVSAVRRRADDRYDVSFGDGGQLTADAVVLAQGHFDVAPTAGESDLERTARERDLVYLKPANAGESDLDGIRAGEPVVLRGLGLSFFDYVALLTLGRGGRFERHDGTLRYVASGREPVLYAGSGRGVPYTARAEVRLEIVPRNVPAFLTAEVIRDFRTRAGAGVTDFRRDLWPYIERETEWTYYRRLLEDRPDELARFTAGYAAASHDPAARRALIEDVAPDERERWSWDRLDRPSEGVEFADADGYDAWVRARLAHDLEQSVLGPDASATKAVAAALRDLRDEIRQVVSHQGLDGRSYRSDLDGWFSGLINFISSGPPASRVEELIALVDAGVVHFLGPRVRVEAGDDAFHATSPSVPGGGVRARVLVEAYLPPCDIRRAVDPLMAQLRNSGMCRPHVIPAAGGEGYETGAIDIVEGTQRLVTADGEEQPGMFCFGPPVESVQWVTAIGARPHVNSRTLLQADAIARAALETAGASSVLYRLVGTVAV